MVLIDRRAAFGALVPLVIVLIAIIWTSVTATTTRTIETAVDSPWLIFGVFADRFPVLAFAVIFVLTRLIVTVFVVRRPNILFRLILLIPALALVLAAALYPTFGGLIARPGFIGSGFSLINSAISGAPAGYLVGGAIAGVMLGLVTGLARMIIDWSWGFTWGKPIRAILALIAYAAMGAILAWGWATLSAAGALFPRGPLTIVETTGLIGLIIVATAPQIVVAALADAARRR
jgi:hypothetical protein